MKLLHLSLSAPDKFEEIQSLLGPDGLGLIGKIHIQPMMVAGEPWTPAGDSEHRPKIYWIIFRLGHGTEGKDQPYSFAQLSLGTRRIIRIIVSMIFDESSVMLIEHPEDGIHRGLTRKVFSLLRSYTDPGQAIISSHSASVFDMMDPAGVRLVTLEGGETKAHALTDGEIERAKRYINEDGAFSDFLETHYDL